VFRRGETVVFKKSRFSVFGTFPKTRKKPLGNCNSWPMARDVCFRRFPEEAPEEGPLCVHALSSIGVAVCKIQASRCSGVFDMNNCLSELNS